MVTISRAEYECLKAERDELNQKLDWLLEQAHLSRKKLCGAFSERLGEELMNRLRRMFDETEAWLSKRRDKRTKAAAHTRRSLNTPPKLNGDRYLFSLGGGIHNG